jgi:CobW/HypB/UreG, nucleotide-binding domain
LILAEVLRTAEDNSLDPLPAAKPLEQGPDWQTVPVTLITGKHKELDSARCSNTFCVLDVPEPGRCELAALSEKCQLVPCHAGFLGAGKSTLVKHILTVKHGFRIAVIMNEFGDEANVERAMVEGPDVSRLQCNQSHSVDSHREGSLSCTPRMQAVSVQLFGFGNPQCLSIFTAGDISGMC